MASVKLPSSSVAALAPLRKTNVPRLAPSLPNQLRFLDDAKKIDRPLAEMAEVSQTVEQFGDSEVGIANMLGILGS
jgi:hypothetical protein